ncbi:MAG: hypothetical protein QM572_01140 [Nocardioides sp.]|uniref:hypothetical protein n=1 Tax=Nocardioides sp. TaxID=35761 RepID=UPI0039E250E9
MSTRQPSLRVLSYGGGTQSAALALMSATGVLPRLDAVIFADTHGELPETYEYAEYVKTHLVRAGIPFVRVSTGSLEAALLSPVRTSSNPTPPAHVLNPDGSRGKVLGYRCSYDYKRRVVTRKVKRLANERGGGPGAWKRSRVEQWLGFSVDEMARCKESTECRCGHPRLRVLRGTSNTDGVGGHRPGCDRCDCAGFDAWQVNVWPLIKDFGLSFRRSDTIGWFAQNGHPTPPRSTCWFCPNSRNARWAALKTEHPDLWERACVLDEHIRNGGAFNARGGTAFAGQMFLHSDRVPLRDVDLRSEAERQVDAGQGVLFDEAALSIDCISGACFT